MNAEEFYERFKDALDAIGAGWSGKESVRVTIEGNRIIFTGEVGVQKTTVSIKIGEHD